MKMYNTVGVNTDKRDYDEITSSNRTSSAIKLKERNVNHTTISGVKDLGKLYVYGEMLGQGVFGTVMEVTDKSTNKVWALKIVDKTLNQKGPKFNNIENEIKILKIVSHPHIIYLERTFESTKKIYLVLERCTGELATILKQKSKFTEDETRKVIDHLSQAIAYLHKYEIVHRDLKMENILTAPNPNDPSDELYIKVSDFGLGIIKSGNRPNQMLSERCGTLAYMAPEIISRGTYSQQCDVWAMGVVMYILLTGRYPFFSRNEKDLSKMICSQEPCFAEFTASPEAIHLLTKMLAKNPAMRICAAEVGLHAWIRREPMKHDSPENVLDMMQLWRSEMMIPQDENQSDWATAFSTYTKSQSNADENDNDINTDTKEQKSLVQKDVLKADLERMKSASRSNAPRSKSSLLPNQRTATSHTTANEHIACVTKPGRISLMPIPRPSRPTRLIQIKTKNAETLTSNSTPFNQSGANVPRPSMKDRRFT